METIRGARARVIAGLTAVSLGSVTWSATAADQGASGASTNATAATNAATANTATSNAASTTAATDNTTAATAANRGRGGGNNGGSNGGGGSSRGGGTDPGVRGGDPGAGGALQGLNTTEQQFFEAAKGVFNEVDAVPEGLGPRFNLDSCAGCHAFPTTGGSSPATNPQVAIATAAGGKNTVPSFITANGPIREARFVRNPDGSPDGSVHGLFVISGRSDAPGCNITQPNFAQQVARNNVIFRIPTPLYGLGLVENVSEGALQSSLAANVQQKRSLGISGHFNINTNDTTIARFGWKAQNKSLLLFSGEAYNVEMGITNDLFQNERDSDPNCQFNATPESAIPLVAEDTGSDAGNFQSDIEMFSSYMRLLAPPAPAGSGTTPVAQATGQTTGTATQTTGAAGQTTGAASTAATTASTASTMVASAAADVSSVMTAAAGSTAASAAQSSASSSAGASVTRGSQVFNNIGCQACHTQSFTTSKAQLTGQSNVTIQPFSDFAVHDMGSGLADGVTQGTANGNEFRTAPLWGVGQRIFFLHDGRTKDLSAAIQQHASRGSEANTVINNYNMLSQTDQQSLLNFLRSL
jgi:CxxC motif-containing protein (DUF1111 family)